jgi:hypothetical protein
MVNHENCKLAESDVRRWLKLRRRASFALAMSVLTMLATVVARAPGAGASTSAAAASASAASSPSSAPAADNTVAPRGAPKEASREVREVKVQEKVHVGLYLNQVYELSLKDAKLVVDFWLWFRWKNDELKPYESFEIKNGRIDNKGEVVVKKIGDMNYAYLRVVANVTHFWDISAYPLDQHTVPIIIEDADKEEESLVYVPDVASSGIGDGIAVAGFTTRAATAHVDTSLYHTNYGDISLPSQSESRYSRFVFPVLLSRPGLQYFLKLFFGLFIAVAIGFLAFFIKPTDLDPRFGLGVGAIFAAVASEYVVTGALPESAMISLADKLHIVAFAAIFITLVESTWSLHWCTSGREEASRRLDKRAAAIVPIAYVIVTLLVVWRR